MIKGSNILSYGFRSFREQKRFAKLLAIVTLYQNDPDWECGVKATVRSNCLIEAAKLKLPWGWQSVGTYDELKE